MSATLKSASPMLYNNSPAKEGDSKSGWQLKKLTPKHKQLCSMLAQGVERQTMASILDWTPEHIDLLTKQTLVKDYIREMCQAAGLQLDAMFVKSVEAIGETLVTGNANEKMKAARLQLEATKRIGANSGLPTEVIDTNARLVKLAERLLYLQGGNARVINGDSE